MTSNQSTATELSRVEISCVLPCLDEALTIESCIRECLRSMQSLGLNGEVVVADNGSTDRSQELANRAGARVIQVAERGYGNALISGIRSARGKYVLMGDSDMSYDFSELPRFLEKLHEGHDLVMGCRMPRGGGIIQQGAMPFLHRWVGNPVLSFLGRVLFRIKISDFHCGIRAFDRDRILGLRLQSSGMEFASEMVVKASLARLSMAQVPVTLRRDGRGRPPHLRTWRDGWRHLKFMLLHAPRWVFLYPGLSVMGMSLVLFILLLPEPLRVGPVRLDTNTLLVAGVGILGGFQTMLMGLFSEVFCCTTGLLPPTRLVQRILTWDPFEKGILFGGLLFATGALCLADVLLKWKVSDFGDLTYSDNLRLIIPSAIAMLLGFQSVFGGFVLAVLGLRSGTGCNALRPVL